MRKFRCPHCGAKTITYGERFASHFTGYRKYYVTRHHRMACEKCGGMSMTSSTSNFVGVIAIIVLLISFIMFIFMFIAPKICLWLCLSIFVLLGILITIDVFTSPLVGIDPSGFEKFNGISEHSPANASVLVNSNRDIRPYWIYGVKFEVNTENAKFHDRFKDGLVPVVFHEKRKGSNAFEVRIIGKEFVPEELLHVGSEFLVEDNDKFICRGKVTGVFEVGKQDS